MLAHNAGVNDPAAIAYALEIVGGKRGLKRQSSNVSADSEGADGKGKRRRTPKSTQQNLQRLTNATFVPKAQSELKKVEAEAKLKAEDLARLIDTGGPSGPRRPPAPASGWRWL